MKYRKKPVEVEAIQFTGNNVDEIKKCFPFIILRIIKRYHAAGCSDETFRELPAQEIHVVTLEGDMKVNICDWIVKGIAGEFYPVKPDIFEKTYEKVKDDTKISCADEVQ